jgi:hypothetical protein
VAATVKFAIRRRVDGLTPDEIDAEIMEQQKRAEELLEDLTETIERQGQLYREIRPEGKEGQGDPESPGE